MKEVFIFNENSRAAVYGIGTYINQLVTCLKQENLKLNVVNLRCEQNEYTEEVIDKVHYFHIPRNQVYTNTQDESYKYYRNVLYLLYPYINNKFDLIFHLNYNHGEKLVDLLKSHFPSCKIVSTIHYQDWCFALSGNTSYFKDILYAAQTDGSIENTKGVYTSFKNERSYFHKVDKLICLSAYTRDLLVSLYEVPEDKISLIYNGLKDEGTMISEEEKAVLKNAYGIAADSKIVLFVGRLDPIKGVEYLIRAFNKISNQIPASHLILIGDGEFSLYLKECTGCWGKFTFTGKLSKEQVYRFYQLADIGVMPSLHEQCSYVAIEMMMFGVPLIVSTSTGLNEMVEEGIGGMKIQVIEKKDSVDISAEELSNKMLALLTMPDEQTACMRKQSRIMFKTRYRLERMNEKLLSFYSTL